MLGGPADGPDDVLVSGAPADLAGYRGADLLVRRVGVVVEQPARGQHDARCAETALEAVAAGESLLHRVELAAALQALDGAYPTAVGHGREHCAGLHRHVVEPEDACAAVRCVAPPVRAGQAEIISDEVNEEQSRLDDARVLGPVDVHGDLHVRFPASRVPRRASRAGCLAPWLARGSAPWRLARRPRGGR